MPRGEGQLLFMRVRIPQAASADSRVFLRLCSSPHVHKRFLHSALFSQALFVTSSLLHQVNKPTLLISKIVANKNAVESEMHVPASSDFVTEVKVPQADPPALRCLSTLYRHPVVEAGLCSPVTHALFLFYRICLIS